MNRYAVAIAFAALVPVPASAECYSVCDQDYDLRQRIDRLEYENAARATQQWQEQANRYVEESMRRQNEELRRSQEQSADFYRRYNAR